MRSFAEFTPARVGELLGRHRGDAAVVEAAEHAQIGGQPGDGRVGHARSARYALRSADIGTSMCTGPRGPAAGPAATRVVQALADARTVRGS